MPKKVAVGVVASDKNDKTRRVEIQRRVKHPVRQVHAAAHRLLRARRKQRIGRGRHGRDRRVATASKTKRWDLVRVVEKSRAVDVAALRAAAKQEAAKEG